LLPSGSDFIQLGILRVAAAAAHAQNYLCAPVAERQSKEEFGWLVETSHHHLCSNALGREKVRTS
jgi:hypothetical protein